MNPRLMNEEPIPGYRLIERIGRGGYGEVWKAEAPGGILKAIKFVHGDLESTEEEGKAAEQELKALNRVKTIRHPYILSLERFDIIDGRLMIVTELADRNLWDRFLECRDQNLPGIPREELLSYMDEAAEAIDLMNNHYQIQHLDIKPQNLFLVFNHIKVADFGLAKDFEGRQAAMTGGVTPVYAAPETFEGWVSRFCDQYSLAIVYQELLTGIRPFSGTAPRQLLMQHITAPPDVSPLPPAEQEVIRRALSKTPDDRFPTCTAMVKLLRNCHRASATSSLPTPIPSDKTDPLAATSLDLNKNRSRSGKLLPPLSVPNSSLPKSNSKLGPNLVTPGTAHTNSTPSQKYVIPVPITQIRSLGPSSRVSGELIASQERTGSGVLFPALIIGIGNTGLSIIQTLRKSIVSRFGANCHLPHLRWLFIDTDAEAIQSCLSAHKTVALTSNEVLYARLNRPGHYLRREGIPPVDQWMTNETLYRIQREGETQGIRSLGRLALCDHYHPISHRIRYELEYFLQDDSLEESARQTGFSMRTNLPRIYIVTSLSGGTGSGMLNDLCYIAKRELQQLGFHKSSIIGVGLAPKPDSQGVTKKEVANTYATLHELLHFSSPASRFETRYDLREAAIRTEERPLHRLILVPYTHQSQQTHTATDQAAGALMHELFSKLGRIADTERDRFLEQKSFSGLPVQTMGLHRLIWPREQIVDQIRTVLTHDLLAFWNNKECTQKSTVKNWIEEQWFKLQIDSTLLERRILNHIDTLLPKPWHSEVDRILAPLNNTLDQLSPNIICSVFDQLILLIGKPGTEEASKPGRIPELLQPALKRTLSDLEKDIAKMCVHFIERPGLRFAAAEEAIRLIRDRLLNATTQLQQEEREIDRETVLEFNRIFPLIGSMPNGVGLLSWGSRVSRLVNEIREALRTYAQKRFALTIVRTKAGFYRHITTNTVEYLREITTCRSRLNDLRTRIQEEFRRSGPDLPVFDSSILPTGCHDFVEAANQIRQEITDGILEDLDYVVQEQINQDYKALISVCVKLKEPTFPFGTYLLEMVRQFVDEKLEHLSVAEIFFRCRTDLQAAQRDVYRAYEESAPDLIDIRSNRDAEVFFLGLPDGEAGERFRQLVKDCFPDANLIPARNDHAIEFYREMRCIPIVDLPQFSRIAYEKAQEYLTEEQISPYSRNDIRWEG